MRLACLPMLRLTTSVHATRLPTGTVDELQPGRHSLRDSILPQVYISSLHVSHEVTWGAYGSGRSITSPACGPNATCHISQAAHSLSARADGYACMLCCTVIGEERWEAWIPLTFRGVGLRIRVEASRRISPPATRFITLTVPKRMLSLLLKSNFSMLCSPRSCCHYYVPMRTLALLRCRTCVLSPPLDSSSGMSAPYRPLNL